MGLMGTGKGSGICGRGAVDKYQLGGVLFVSASSGIREGERLQYS